MASRPSGPYDTSPLGTGKNFVTEGGGLDPFTRAVAHALIRNGHSESEAVQIAIGHMRAWVADPHTTPETKAKAAAAIANWERLKAQAHATPNKSVKTSVRLGAAMTPDNSADDGPQIQMCPTCGGPARARLQSVHPDAVRMSAIDRLRGVSLTKMKGETKAMTGLPPELKAKAIAKAKLAKK